MKDSREAAPGGLQKKTRASLFWSGGSYLLTAILNFGTLFLLAQLLKPAEMGVIFMGILFQDLSLLCVDTGLGSYVVQAPEFSLRERSSLFWQALTLAGALTACLYGTAPYISDYFNDPTLAGALRVSAFGFVALALGFPQKALLQKSMRFRPIALAEFLGMLGATVFTCVTTLKGWGVYGYLVGFLVRRGIEVGVVWAAEPWMPRPVIIGEQVKKLLIFGFFSSSSAMLSYAVRLVDTLVIGRILGVHAYGLYSLASNFIFFPVSKCVTTFSRVYMATFSHLKGGQPNTAAEELKNAPQSTEELRRAFLKALNNCLFLILPGLTVLALLIPEILALLFPKQWEPTGPLVRILAINGLTITFMRLGEPALTALGRVRILFGLNGLNIVLTGALLLALAPHGLDAAAWAVVLSGLVVQAGMLAVLKNTLKLGLWESYSAIKAVAFASAAMAGCLTLLKGPLIETLELPWALTALLLVAIPVYWGSWKLMQAPRAPKQESLNTTA